jgi:uncharacterized OsmC-like protein
VESEDGVLVIRRIHVVYHLRGGVEHAEAVERVHALHRDYCPVYRTLAGCIDITTEVVEAPD